MKELRFTLPVVSPYQLDLTVWALKRREKNEVDHWDGTDYVRVLVIDNILVKIKVSQKGSRIAVEAKASKSIPKLRAKLSVLLNRILGLKVNLSPFYRFAKTSTSLEVLVHRFKGVKPPRFPTVFEAIVNAVAFQQLSLEAGFSLLNKLIEEYGRPFREKRYTFYAFPEPKQIMKRRPEELMKLGFSRSKSNTLIHVATELQNYGTTFDQLDRLSNEDLISFFYHFKGIGRWSSEYILLRGFGRIELLPGDDTGIKKSIKKLFHLHKTPEYDQIKKIERKWQPYAGLIYFHLLLQKLQKMGLLP